MPGIIRSEYLKHKRTFSVKLTWIMPVTTLLLSFVLMGGRLFQFGAYNWWYTLLLPGSLSVFCAAVIQRDEKMKYRGVLPFPVDLSRIWLGKVITGLLFLLSSCIVFFLGVTIGGYLAGQDIALFSSVCGILVLFITFSWQVPFCMFLTTKIGMFGAILINMFASFGFSILSVKDGLWLVPYALPARLMCPILKLHPNGIPLEAENVLLNTSVIVPGIAIAVSACILLTLLTALRFRRQEAK